jgi:hypothetical protein
LATADEAYLTGDRADFEPETQWNASMAAVAAG